MGIVALITRWDFPAVMLIHVTSDAVTMSEETYGSIAEIVAFDTEEQIIARAIDTENGLVAYLHSHNPRRNYLASRALQFGMDAANRTKGTGAGIAFGGTKQSGLGRDGPWKS